MLQNITLRLSKRQKNTRKHMFFCLILPRVFKSKEMKNHFHSDALTDEGMVRTRKPKA